mgnify:FL=1
MARVAREALSAVTDSSRVLDSQAVDASEQFVKATGSSRRSPSAGSATESATEQSLNGSVRP